MFAAMPSDHPVQTGSPHVAISRHELRMSVHAVEGCLPVTSGGAQGGKLSVRFAGGRGEGGHRPERHREIQGLLSFERGFHLFCDQVFRVDGRRYRDKIVERRMDRGRRRANEGGEVHQFDDRVE